MINRYLFITLCLFFTSCAAHAVDETATVDLLDEFQQEFEKLKQTNQVYEKVIRNLIQRIERLEADSEGAEQAPTPTPVNRGESSATPEIEARIKKEGEENYQLIQDAFEQRLSRSGGMLLPQYQMTYELGFSYAHSSYDSIVVDGFTVYPVLVIGDIVSEKIRRNIFTNTHSFRLGLGWDMQMDLMLPFTFKKEESFRDDGVHEASETTGAGDISIGLSYQLIKGHQSWPDSVMAINWKLATGGDPYQEDDALGSGFETLGLSFTSMATADPLVLFGGFSSSYTPSEKKQIGRIQPGAGYGLNLGMALALNFYTSMSFNYQLHFTEETTLNGEKLSGSGTTTSTFGIGFSKARGEQFAYDIDLGIGLTRDSPDFQLSISFPFEYAFAKSQP